MYLFVHSKLDMYIEKLIVLHVSSLHRFPYLKLKHSYIHGLIFTKIYYTDILVHIATKA